MPCGPRLCLGFLMGVALALLVPGCYRAPVKEVVETADSNAQAAPEYLGSLDAVDDRWIVGWACDVNRPNTPLAVDIYEDGKLLATAKADILRDDLAKAGRGNGKHGFRHPAPSRWKQGAATVVRATISGTAIDLPGSPTIVNAKPNEPTTKPAPTTNSRPPKGAPSK
jgi:hypothetical protein